MRLSTQAYHSRQNTFAVDVSTGDYTQITATEAHLSVFKFHKISFTCGDISKTFYYSDKKETEMSGMHFICFGNLHLSNPDAEDTGEDYLYAIEYSDYNFGPAGYSAYITTQTVNPSSTATEIFYDENDNVIIPTMITGVTTNPEGFSPDNFNKISITSGNVTILKETQSTQIKDITDVGTVEVIGNPSLFKETLQEISPEFITTDNNETFCLLLVSGEYLSASGYFQDYIPQEDYFEMTFVKEIETTVAQLDSVLQSLPDNKNSITVTNTVTKSTVEKNSFTDDIVAGFGSSIVLDGHTLEKYGNGEYCGYAVIPKKWNKLIFSCEGTDIELSFDNAKLFLPSGQETYNVPYLYWGTDPKNYDYKLDHFYASTSFYYKNETFSENGIIRFYDENNIEISLPKVAIFELANSENIISIPETGSSITIGGNTYNLINEHLGTIITGSRILKYIGNGNIAERTMGGALSLSMITDMENHSPENYDTGENWCLMWGQNSECYFIADDLVDGPNNSITIVQNNVTKIECENIVSKQLDLMSVEEIKIQIGNYSRSIRTSNLDILNFNDYIFIGNPVFNDEEIDYDLGYDYGFEILHGPDGFGNIILNYKFATTNILPDDTTATIEFINYSKVNPYVINLNGVTQSDIPVIKTILNNNPSKYVAIKPVYTENITSLESAFENCENLCGFSPLPENLSNAKKAFKNCYAFAGDVEFSNAMTTIEEAFCNTKIKSIKNIELATNYKNAFINCSKLEIISDWNFSNNESYNSDLFMGCVNLSEIYTSSGIQAAAMKKMITDGKKNFNLNLIPLFTSVKTGVSYVPNMQIPFSILDETLQSWSENTPSTPYIIDVTELTDLETNATFDGSGDTVNSPLSIVMLNNSNKYVYLKESSTSVSSKSFIYAFSTTDGDMNNNLVGIDISNCNTILSVSFGFVYCMNLTECLLPNSIRDVFSSVEEFEEYEPVNPDDYFEAYKLLGMTYAFMGCLNLHSLNIPANIKMLVSTFAYSGMITGVIPEGITVVSMAYEGCDLLTSVDIRSNVIEQMNDTFSDCSSLTTVGDISGPIKNMNGCFDDCSSLVSAGTITTTATNADFSYLFSGCSNLQSAPELIGNITILEYAFNECVQLTQMPDLPESVKNINGVFYNCSNITELTNIPDSVETMNNAFLGTGITEVPDIPSGVTDISHAFKDTPITTVRSIPAFDHEVKLYNCFGGCTSLTTVESFDMNVQPDYTEYYEMSMFEDCTSLQSIVATNKYAEAAIEYMLAYDKQQGRFPSTIDIPTLVTCDNNIVPFPHLKDYLLIVPANTVNTPYEIKVTEVLRNSNFKEPLQSNPNKYVDLSDTELPNTIFNMVGYFSDCNTLIKSPSIPDPITDITNCFWHCTALKEIPNIPEHITTMISSFEGCTSLTEVPELPDSVKNMRNCFNGCTSLTTIHNIPDSVKNMLSCFEECSSLTTIPNIPKNVANMAFCFYNCTSLTTIEKWEPSALQTEQINMTNCFVYCPKLTTIKIPVKKVSEDNKWKYINLSLNGTTVNYYIYNLDGTLAKSGSFNYDNTIPLNIDGKIDEFIQASDLTTEQVVSMLEKQKQFTSDSSALDPNHANFVLWADNPNYIKTNLPSIENIMELTNNQPAMITQNTTIVPYVDSKAIITATSPVTLSFSTQKVYAGLEVDVINLTNISHTVNGTSLGAGQRAEYIWNGSSWVDRMAIISSGSSKLNGQGIAPFNDFNLYTQSGAYTINSRTLLHRPTEHIGTLVVNDSGAYIHQVYTDLSYYETYVRQYDSGARIWTEWIKLANAQFEEIIFDLTSYSYDRFFPLVFPASVDTTEVYIREKLGLDQDPYNNHTFHAFFRSNGWSDIPPSYQILENQQFSKNEQSIMALCRGESQGSNAIYLRGGLKYYVRSNNIPTLHTTNYTFYDETWRANISDLTMGAHTKVWCRLSEHINEPAFSNFSVKEYVSSRYVLQSMSDLRTAIEYAFNNHPITSRVTNFTVTKDGIWSCTGLIYDDRDYGWIEATFYDGTQRYRLSVNNGVKTFTQVY